MEATWTEIGSSLYKADPQRVAEEIMAIGDEATPAQIVEKAKEENSELHKCFTWDDQCAAQKWRLHQARHIVCNLVIKRDEEHSDKPDVRVFHKNDNGGYKTIIRIFNNTDEHEKLLQAAYADLAAFKRKYESLQELDYILDLIK